MRFSSLFIYSESFYIIRVGMARKSHQSSALIGYYRLRVLLHDQ